MSAATLLAALALAAAPTTLPLPHGVRHVAASDAAMATARTRLLRLTAPAGRDGFATALNATPLPGRQPLMLGTFSSQQLQAQPGFDPAAVRTGKGKVPIVSDVPTDFPVLAAASEPQRAYLAARIAQWLPPGAPTALRVPTFEELATIWFFIGWDLDGPLLVAEWDAMRVVFDFDASGERIEWMERLDQPCFPLQLDVAAGSECYCLGIERRELQWTATYVPAETENQCRT